MAVNKFSEYINQNENIVTTKEISNNSGFNERTAGR